MNYFKKRKTMKTAKDVLHHASLLRNMREDLMREGDIERLAQAEANLSEAMRKDDAENIHDKAMALYDVARNLTPHKRFASFRENFEVIVVALAVAMAIKAYFLQPFKIPTGSMQPTLYGVTVEESGYVPNVTDMPILKTIKWLITGASYKKIVVKEDGYFSGWFDSKYYGENNLDPVYMFCKIGNIKYKVPESASVNINTTGLVEKGTVLWEGVMNAGDHVFVDKISWNFRRPRRGEIIVFKTDNIKGITRGSHYIKRLVGLPGEHIRITPPSIQINGETLTKPRQIVRIQDQDGRYENGYQNGGYYLRTPDSIFDIPSRGYVAFGDNTSSSQDSRYWGAVPSENMMGPALWVYWPLTRRWGYANK